MIVTTEITKTVLDTDKVEEIVRELLDERFGDEFVFDPIEITPRVFDDGEYAEDYLQIFIVFDGDSERLPPSWTGTLARRIRPAMMKMGWEISISKSFVEKSEWEEILIDQNRG